MFEWITAAQPGPPAATRSTIDDTDARTSSGYEKTIILTNQARELQDFGPIFHIIGTKDCRARAEFRRRSKNDVAVDIVLLVLRNEKIIKPQLHLYQDSLELIFFFLFLASLS